MIEIFLGLAAVAFIAGRPPKLFVLKTADAGQHRGDAAGKVRHVHGEFGMAVEHAGID